MGSGARIAGMTRNQSQLVIALLIALGALAALALVMWLGWEDAWPWIKENVLTG